MRNDLRQESLTWRGVVEAGFPTSASEELVDTMRLDEYLIDNKEASYLLRVKGRSMVDAGILPGDIVIVERGRQPKSGDIVIADVDGEYMMSYFPLKAQEKLIVVAVVRSVVRKY